MYVLVEVGGLEDGPLELVFGVLCLGGGGTISLLPICQIFEFLNLGGQITAGGSESVFSVVCGRLLVSEEPECRFVGHLQVLVNKLPLLHPKGASHL